MLFDDSFWRALADYGLKFPTVESLGTAAGAWLCEYSRLRENAFGAVLITSGGIDGTTGGGQRQFPQETLLDALHCVRHDLDCTYRLPAHLARYPSERRSMESGGNRGFLLAFKPAS